MAKDICCKISGKLFALNIDAIIIKNNHILLIKRDKEPFKGLWTLPGGRVKINEMLTEAVIREVKEETGIKINIIDMFSEYSTLDRDPRGRFVSIVFICAPKSDLPKKRTKEASDIKYFSFDKLPRRMAFDHKKILKDFLKYAYSEEAGEESEPPVEYPKTPRPLQRIRPISHIS